MNFLRQVERLKLLVKLIEQEGTGTPEELARRLGVKRRTLYEMIDALKSLGTDIRYDRKLYTFYYAGEEKIDLSFSLSIMRKGELEKISGGKRSFTFRAFFPH